MKNIYRLENVSDYNNSIGVETLHPMVSLIDFSKTKIENSIHSHLYFGIYAIFFKETDCGELRYGKANYDYEEGTLVFISPGQVIEIVRKQPETQRKGLALLFHPDLIHGTSLGRHINDYSFFSYATNEALHVSEKERKIVFDCFSKINNEIEERIDKHSRKLIVNNIELFLDYCIRFYDRQFLTREDVNKGTVEQFERILEEYFKSNQPQLIGLPSVSYIADKLNISANYFGDLIKKETGKSAQEYIHLKLMLLAKNKILDTSKPVSEIAYELGFKYPQHFTRMFKKSEGVSPSEYRSAN